MMKFRKDALRATLLAMNSTHIAASVAARVAVMMAGEKYLGLVKQNMSLRDHTLRDLARMGHPYARSGGSIRIHSGSGKTIANPKFRVHQQTGTLLNATDGGMRPSAIATYRVALDTGAAPHAIYVVQGTRHMLARDVLWSTAQARGTRKILRKEVIRALGPILRTKALIRLGPVGS